MRLVVPIRLSTRSGSGHGEVREVISLETKEFLQTLGDKIFGDIGTVETRISPEFVDTQFSPKLPVNSPRMVNAKGLIENVGQHLESHPTCSELIVDVGGPNFDLAPHVQLIMALADLSEWFVVHHPGKKLLITLPDTIDPDSQFAFKIAKLEAGAFTFNYSSLQVSGPGGEIDLSPEDSSTLKAFLEKSKISNKDKLAKLIVCHLGKYYVQNTDQIIYDYYEGDHAHDQIYLEFRRIVETRFNAVPRGATKLNVLYDDRGSFWFSTAVRNAVKHISNAEFFGVSEFYQDDFEEHIDLVFLPVVRTGKSVIEILKRNPELFHNDNTEFWTLIKIGNGGASETFSDEKGLQVTVNSLVNLGSRGDQVRDTWGNSLPLEPVPVSEIDLAGNFSSECMYSMLYEAGIKDETEVPAIQRSELGFVMDTTRMIELNAPLFASKIRFALTQKIGPVATANVTFLHPDENAANLLASAVNEVSNNDSIRVNPTLISLANDANSTAELQKKAAAHSPVLADYCNDLISYLLRLKTNDNLSMTSQLKLVLLYEFNALGGTLRGMKSLASLVGFDVVSSVALANMVPSVEDSAKPEISFYDFGYDPSKRRNRQN